MSSRRVARQRQCDPNRGTPCDSPVPTNPNTDLPSSSTGTPSTTYSTSPSVAYAESSSTTTAPKPTAVAAVSSPSNAGTIAGSVIGSVIFLVVVVLGILLYLRARKKKRTPPSSEFMNSIRAGTAPVLRLDSGAEYTPALSEKSAGYTPYPPNVPLPFMQNSYYTSPPMLNMKFPDEMMDVPSARPSIDKPLHPQRFSSPQQTSDSFVPRHLPSTSVGSRRELWGSDAEVVLGESVRQSPAHTDSNLHFTPRFSFDNDPSSLPSHPSHSPPSLHPLRRQPDPDGA